MTKPVVTNDYRLKNGQSFDIAFCEATDCLTKCQRNTNMELFKKMVKGKGPAIFSIATLHDTCSSYQKP